MSGNQNGTPQFDFSELSWGDEKAFSRINLLILKSQEINDADMLSEAHQTLDGYMAKIITYIPRDWLINSAPESIDWKDPASLNYIRSKKVGDLRAEMVKAKQGN
jgi:hypothetical protein